MGISRFDVDVLLSIFVCPQIGCLCEFHSVSFRMTDDKLQNELDFLETLGQKHCAKPTEFQVCGFRICVGIPYDSIITFSGIPYVQQTADSFKPSCLQNVFSSKCFTAPRKNTEAKRDAWINRGDCNRFLNIGQMKKV